MRWSYFDLRLTKEHIRVKMTMFVPYEPIQMHYQETWSLNALIST